MVLLRGVPVPLAATFRQLGVDIAIGAFKITRPVLSRRLEAGQSALSRLPHLSTYDRRERAISTLVTPLALHGVAVASVTEPDLRGLETVVVRALWGATRLSRAKEVIFTVLSKGHRVSLVMHTRYERLLWLARVARRPRVTQVFAQAIWESGGRPSGTGPVGRALRTAATLTGARARVYWCWDVPGQEHPLHFVQEPLRQLQHRGRDSLRCHSSRQLEARRPVTLGGQGDGADGPACRAALRAASTELEKSLLRGLMARAMWAAARVSGHGTRTNSACPHCGAAHEDEVHSLWNCPEWNNARGTWRPWLSNAAQAIPHLGPPDQWASCLRKAGLFPLRLAQGVDRGLRDEFMYCLYGMYPAVLATCMAASQGDQPGHGDSLFPNRPRPRPRNPYPWDDFVSPLPGDTIRHQPRLRPGTPPDWRWPQDFIHDLVRWPWALAWVPGLAEVSWAKLALDYEAFVRRALPASPDQRLRATCPLLRERAQILRKAVGLAERHLAAGALVSGALLGRFRSLLPLGGRVCAGLSARLFFAARREVIMQLMRLATHYRDSWVWLLRAPARMRPPLGDRFLMDYFQRPLEGGEALLPYARRPRRAPPQSVPLTAPQRSRPLGAGGGTQGALCLEHGAPSCARCKSTGWGISRCCRAGHDGHTGPSAGPRCPRVPPRVAPGCQVLVPEDRRTGVAALSSWLGRARPASQALPSPGPPAARRCTAPPRTLGTRHSSTLRPHDPRPTKRHAPKLLLANREGSRNVEPPRTGEGVADPFSPPLAGRDDGPGPVAAAASASTGSTGALPAPRDPPPPPPPAEPPPPPPTAGGRATGVAP